MGSREALDEQMQSRMPDVDAPETGKPAGMYTPSQLRLLKLAVIAMGVILLLGFATVIGRIVYLVNTAPSPRAPAASATAGGSLSVPAELALPKGAVIRQMTLSGHVLAVHFEAPGGAGIRILDLSTGGRAHAITIVEEMPQRAK